MYTNSLSVTNYHTGASYRVEINASHVRVFDKTGNMVLNRATNDKNELVTEWYDYKHKRIVDAIHLLEAAILAAVED